MRSTKVILIGIILLPAALVVMACSKSGAPSASQQKTSEVSRSQPDAPGETHAQDAQDSKITAAFAELSADDRALAIKQKVCPVSGELLGSMGAPLKIDVKGQPVFICCEGCKDELLAKPDEYLAKINK